MKIVKLALIAAAVSLAGCETTQNVPDITVNNPVPVPRPVIAPMELDTVHWTVRDVAGLRALADRMEATGQTQAVFYILDQDSYNALAMNISEVRRYINDQDAANDFLAAALATNGKKPTAKKDEKKAEQPKPRRKLLGIL